MRRTSVSQLQDFLDVLATKVPADFSVHATPIFGSEWLVKIESATQLDQYHVDMDTMTWCRYVQG